MNLSKINGIGKTSLELLEAAGFDSVDSLAKVGVDELVRELERTNSVLKIAKRNPSRSVVVKWIRMACDMAGESPETSETSRKPELVNYEQSPQVASMLPFAPLALPLPARVLVENKLPVSEIPVGILLSSCSGDLEVRVERRLPQHRQSKQAASGYVMLADHGTHRVGIDVSNLRSTDDMEAPQPKVARSMEVTPVNERIALLRSPRASTNAGRDPNSRWYIRGVLHSHPVSIYMGAIVTLLLVVILPVSLVSATLLFLSSEMPEIFGWVPTWLLVAPAALPFCGIAYLLWAVSKKCRICGQQLFVRRRHLKNSKAHHIPGLGYIVPLCLQIIIFRWFRCTHCGTPVRLKE